MNLTSRQFEVFRLSNIPIRIDFSWFAIFAVYSWTISTIYLPSITPGVSKIYYWIFGMATVALLFLSILAHEMAHSIVARREGIGIKGITLYIFGGLAFLESEPKNPKSEFLIAVAGPAASFLVALLFYALDEIIFYSTTDLTYLAASKALLHLGAVNLLVACFNLLPGFPMDGGRVLRAFLWHRRKDYESATRSSLKAGATIAFSLMSVGLVTLLMRGDWLTGLWSIMTGLLLVRLLYSIQPEILRSVKASRKEKGRVGIVEEVMTKSVDSALPEMSVSDFLESISNSLDKIAFPVIKERQLHGMLKASDAKNLSAEQRANTCVRELMEPVTGDHFVSRDLPIDEAARRLKSNGLGHAAVIDGEGFVVGYLSLDDLNSSSRREHGEQRIRRTANGERRMGEEL